MEVEFLMSKGVGRMKLPFQRRSKTLEIAKDNYNTSKIFSCVIYIWIYKLKKQFIPIKTY